MNKQKIMNQAMAIIEEWRYTFVVTDALTQFVYHWAFLHTGLYPTDHQMIKDERYNKPAEKLAKLMSESMLNGYGDPIGDLLTRVGLNKELGYFNSAEEVGNLLSKLVGDSSKTISFYEPCSGTGAITMKRMEDIVKTNSGKSNPLVGHTFDLEEVSAINCAASLIQIFHKLEYLSKSVGRYVYPSEISIANVDVINRDKGTHSYHLTQFSEKLGQ